MSLRPVMGGCRPRPPNKPPPLAASVPIRTSTRNPRSIRFARPQKSTQAAPDSAPSAPSDRAGATAHGPPQDSTTPPPGHKRLPSPQGGWSTGMRADLNACTMHGRPKKLHATPTPEDKPARQSPPWTQCTSIPRLVKHVAISMRLLQGHLPALVPAMPGASGLSRLCLLPPHTSSYHAVPCCRSTWPRGSDTRIVLYRALPQMSCRCAPAGPPPCLLRVELLP